MGHRQCNRSATSMSDRRLSEPSSSLQAPESRNAEQIRRQELYDTHANQARIDQQSSSDEFDKSLLTFSSGALGLSLAFIKDVVPLEKAEHLNWLYFSWISFAFCIVATIASFPLGIQAQKIHLEYLYKYYIQQQNEFLNKKSRWSKAVTCCAIVGSICFLAGLLGTMIFVYENVSKGTHR